MVCFGQQKILKFFQLSGCFCSENMTAFSKFEYCLKKLKLILGRRCDPQLDRVIHLPKHYAVISSAKGFVSIRLYYFILGKMAHQKIRHWIKQQNKAWWNVISPETVISGDHEKVAASFCRLLCYETIFFSAYHQMQTPFKLCFMFS